MKYEFPMRGETKELTPEVRAGLAGEFVQLPDGVVHYELGGPEDGPVVALVHGFSVPYFIWDPTFEALVQAGYRVLRYDLFGRGYSDRPHLRNDKELFNRQLADLLDVLGIKKCLGVIGLSMGGVISANFCVQNPDRVEKLILIDPAGFPVEIPGAYFAFRNPRGVTSGRDPTPGFSIGRAAGFREGLASPKIQATFQTGPVEE